MTFPFVRMAAMAFAAAAIMGDDAALAQATKPAAPGQAAAAGPVKLELVGLQPQWTKQCSKDQGGKEVCLTQREFGQVVDQPPTLIIAVYQIGEEHRFARFVLPLGFLLSPGFRLLPEKGEPIPGRFAFCLPQGCFAEAELGNAGINALKKSATASVVVRNQANTEVTFSFPMRDFGRRLRRAADGSQGDRATESGIAASVGGEGASAARTTGEAVGRPADPRAHAAEIRDSGSSGNAGAVGDRASEVDRHCEERSDEATQGPRDAGLWVASLGSQ